MLVSQNVDAKSLFSELRVVIVDEIHAFAGDDRGWHLLAVLERISRIAGRELQRIGLSATVGNPETLVDWLAGSCQGKRDVFLPPTRTDTDADVQLDFVGSLQNAAVVISRLHRGEKRLVFVDSRSRAEQLAADLRQLQVTTFVTHSSLSQEQRNQAEEAFASRDDCVIVATSVLELGIDVGNLDRVIQIDSPPTVSSFLQRMGRTGRRTDTLRNCLFLATKDATLVQAAGLIELWGQGYVEPIEPPTLPYHVLAQQLMALSLQESGIGRATWQEWICGVPGFRSMAPEQVEHIIDWMLDKNILWEDQGILALGREGEETFGRRNFLELFSVFMSPPMFAVLHGRQELGYVDQMSFLGKHEGPRVLLLSGRAWRVNHIDWQRHIAYVEATDARGRSRWRGEGYGLEYRLCQSIKQVLAFETGPDRWSRRARKRIEDVRQEFSWLESDSSAVVLANDGQSEWWTFGGRRANATLARQLGQETTGRVDFDSFALTFQPATKLRDVEQAIAGIHVHDITEMRPAVNEAAVDGLKFSECLPIELAIEMLECRLQDQHATRPIVEEQVRILAH